MIGKLGKSKRKTFKSYNKHRIPNNDANNYAKPYQSMNTVNNGFDQNLEINDFPY